VGAKQGIQGEKPVSCGMVIPVYYQDGQYWLDIYEKLVSKWQKSHHHCHCEISEQYLT
jgi:hypothetical protein